MSFLLFVDAACNHDAIRCDAIDAANVATLCAHSRTAFENDAQAPAMAADATMTNQLLLKVLLGLRSVF